jgi:hypothetical protein
MNTRLLHAAARGARIEFRYEPTSKWFKCRYVPTKDANPTHQYRIHTDDANLAYGPISTALREFADDESELITFSIPSMGMWGSIAAGLDGTWGNEWIKQTLSERALALLILSEALADLGL